MTDERWRFEASSGDKDTAENWWDLVPATGALGSLL